MSTKPHVVEMCIVMTKNTVEVAYPRFWIILRPLELKTFSCQKCTEQ